MFLDRASAMRLSITKHHDSGTLTGRLTNAGTPTCTRRNSRCCRPQPFIQFDGFWHGRWCKVSNGPEGARKVQLPEDKSDSGGPRLCPQSSRLCSLATELGGDLGLPLQASQSSGVEAKVLCQRWLANTVIVREPSIIHCPNSSIESSYSGGAKLLAYNR